MHKIPHDRVPDLWPRERVNMGFMVSKSIRHVLIELLPKITMFLKRHDPALLQTTPQSTINAALRFMHENIERLFAIDARGADLKLLFTLLEELPVTNNLEEITVSNNHLDGDNVSKIASLFKRCPNLKKVDLGTNFIFTNEAITVFAMALRDTRSTSMEWFIMDQNQIRGPEAIVLARAVSRYNVLNKANMRLSLDANFVSPEDQDTIHYHWPNVVTFGTQIPWV